MQIEKEMLVVLFTPATGFYFKKTSLPSPYAKALSLFGVPYYTG